MDALDTQLLLLLAGARKRKREEYELYARNVRAYVTSYFSLHVVKLLLRTRTLILRDNISQPDQCTWRVGYHRAKDIGSSDFLMKFLGIDLVSFELLLLDFKPVITAMWEDAKAGPGGRPRMMTPSDVLGITLWWYRSRYVSIYIRVDFIGV